MIKFKRSAKLAKLISDAVEMQYSEFKLARTQNEGASIDVMQYILQEFETSTAPTIRALIHEIKQFDEQMNALKYAKQLSPQTRFAIRAAVLAR